MKMNFHTQIKLHVSLNAVVEGQVKVGIGTGR
jgi:hypothetical protein